MAKKPKDLNYRKRRSEHVDELGLKIESDPWGEYVSIDSGNIGPEGIDKAIEWLTRAKAYLASADSQPEEKK